MAERRRRAVTLMTLHRDLTKGFGDTQTGFADLKGEIRDLKATIVVGFAGLPTRESSEEMIRVLREGNRLQEERFTHLDLRIREQHLETQQVLHALVEGQRILIEGQRVLSEGQRVLSEGQGVLVEGQGNLSRDVQGLAGEIRSLAREIRSLGADIKSLIARLDALIRGRGDGAPDTGLATT